MRSSKTIHVISAHAEGEVGDVLVGGVQPPPGATLWEQSRWIARDQTLRAAAAVRPNAAPTSSNDRPSRLRSSTASR